MTTDRPNVVGGQSYVPANQSYTNWINVNAFTPQTVGTVGNEMRAQLYGPHQRSADFSLFKDFPIREQMKLQFRADLFNILNHPVFNLPNSQIVGFAPFPNPTAGTIRSTPENNQREIQLSLRVEF